MLHGRGQVARLIDRCAEFRRTHGLATQGIAGCFPLAQEIRQAPTISKFGVSLNLVLSPGRKTSSPRIFVASFFIWQQNRARGLCSAHLLIYRSLD
jgi:hypothetical protein